MAHLSQLCTAILRRAIDVPVPVATGRGALSAQTLPIESMKSCVAQAHNLTNSLCYNFDELLTVYQRRCVAGSELELMLEFVNFAKPAAHR